MSPLSSPLMERIGASSHALCRTLRSRFAQFLQGFAPMSSESPLSSPPESSPADSAVTPSTDSGDEGKQTVAIAATSAVTPPAESSSALPVPSTSRVPLNLQPTKSSMSSPSGLVRRPIDPSPVQVSYTVSIAGTRPVMANPKQYSGYVDLRKAPMIANRPVASNQTEDTDRILEYLD